MSSSKGNALLFGVGLVGGLYLLYKFKEDQVKDEIKETAQLFNPTSDKNLAYTATTAAFGEDLVIEKVGGGIARILGTDPLAEQRKEEARLKALGKKPGLKATHRNTVGILKPSVVKKGYQDDKALLKKFGVMW